MCTHIYIYIYTSAVPHISMCGSPGIAFLALAFVDSMHFLFIAFALIFDYRFRFCFRFPPVPLQLIRRMFACLLAYFLA